MILLRTNILRLRPGNLSSLLRASRAVRALGKLPLHRSSSTANAAKTTAKKSSYPERLLIYHAGTTRTVFLGCLKVTTVFIFTFFSLVVAPAHFYSEDQPKWVSGAVLLSGTIPLLAVFYITSPFVNYIHLRLPSFARQSRELLVRYSKSLPPNTELDITTMNFVGKPRVIRMKVTEVKSKKERFGLVNYVREEEKNLTTKKRPWWMGRKASRFGVHGGRTKIMGGEIWENVRQAIEKRSV